MGHRQVGRGEGKQGGNPVMVCELAQVVNESGGGMARQGFQETDHGNGHTRWRLCFED